MFPKAPPGFGSQNKTETGHIGPVTKAPRGLHRVAGHGVSSGTCASPSGVEGLFLLIPCLCLPFVLLPRRHAWECACGIRSWQILGSLPCPICDSGNQTVFWSCRWRDVLQPLTARSKSPQTQRARDPSLCPSSVGSPQGLNSHLHFLCCRLFLVALEFCDRPALSVFELWGKYRKLVKWMIPARLLFNERHFSAGILWLLGFLKYFCDDPLLVANDC